MAENTIWPETDPQRQTVFHKLGDRLLFRYMNTILEKGSHLHQQRIEYDGSKHDLNLLSEENANSDVQAAMDVPDRKSTRLNSSHRT